MRTALAALAVSTFSLALGGCLAPTEAPAPAAEHVATDEAALMGGEQAGQGYLDETISLGPGNCTAARVGPRHVLTAGHCVFSISTGMLKSQYSHGGWVKMTNSKELANAVTFTNQVYRTYVHPTFVEACRGGCSDDISLRSDHPADVAVIVFTQDLPSTVPQAPIGTSVVGSRSVIVTGYGCERNARLPSDGTRLKYEVSYTVQDPDLDMRYAFIETPGIRTDANEASLCPGDSGGPLYRADGSHAVIGVNAYYLFPDSTSGVSTYNLHTRIGDRRLHDVLSWLRMYIPADRFIP